MGKFRVFELKEDRIMDKKKSEFSEIVSDMSEFAGFLACAAVVAGKKLIRYVNDLTRVDTNLKHPAEGGQRNSKTNAGTDKKK